MEETTTSEYANLRRPPRVAAFSPWGYFTTPKDVPGKVLGVDGEQPVPGRWIIADGDLYTVVRCFDVAQDGKFKMHVLGWSD